MYLLRLSGERVVSTEAKGAVAFQHVFKAFGPKQVLRDVSFQVQPGETLCILGRSGTGKSVTLKLLMALLKPDQGTIHVEQDDIARLNEKGLSKVRRKMGFLFQDAALFDSLTLYENLALPLRRLTEPRRRKKRSISISTRPWRTSVSEETRKRCPRRSRAECERGRAWRGRSCSNRKFSWPMSRAVASTASRHPRLTSCYCGRKPSVEPQSSS
jgi:ABC-type glutathione transport system ATPase component